MGKPAGGPSGAQIPILRGKRRHAAGAPGSQIPFRPAKRSRILGDPLRAGSSSARIKSRGLKRKYLRACSLCLTNDVSWGAKRARSALGGGGNPVLSGGSQTLRPNNSGNSCTRDWANLEDGPAGLIAELALASDVADYVRFRAVCRPWRRCTADPRAAGLDGRFLPRRWIMLDKALDGPRCHRFLNFSTGECIRMKLPELAEHMLLALTPEGLLLLLHEPTLVVRLLNPLTRQLTELPPMTALLTPEQQRFRHRGFKLGERLIVSGAGLVADASIVAVSFCCPMVLAITKPGDESWTTVVDDWYVGSVLPFAGGFYSASSRGVMVLDISSDQQPPQLRMVADIRRSFKYFSSMHDSLHLVDNGGELLLVYRGLTTQDDEDDDDKRMYEVYRVDLDAGILIPVKGLNRRAVFMGMSRSISVSAETFPSVTADTIYLGFDCDMQTGEYNLGNGSSQPRLYDPFLDGMERPCSLVDCLCYCIQGTGRLRLA